MRWTIKPAFMVNHAPRPTRQSSFLNRHFLRGVIVNDSPPLGKLVQDQSEQPALFAAIFHLQVPPARNPNYVGDIRVHLQAGEVEMSHFAALALVASAVALLRPLPAEGNCASGIVLETGRVPVAHHVAADVAVIP